MAGKGGEGRAQTRAQRVWCVGAPRRGVWMVAPPQARGAVPRDLARVAPYGR